MSTYDLVPDSATLPPRPSDTCNLSCSCITRAINVFSRLASHDHRNQRRLLLFWPEQPSAVLADCAVAFDTFNLALHIDNPRSLSASLPTVLH